MGEATKCTRLAPVLGVPLNRPQSDIVHIMVMRHNSKMLRPRNMLHIIPTHLTGHPHRRHHVRFTRHGSKISIGMDFPRIKSQGDLRSISISQAEVIIKRKLGRRVKHARGTNSSTISSKVGTIKVGRIHICNSRRLVTSKTPVISSKIETGNRTLPNITDKSKPEESTFKTLLDRFHLGRLRHSQQGSMPAS